MSIQKKSQVLRRLRLLSRQITAPGKLQFPLWNHAPGKFAARKNPRTSPGKTQSIAWTLPWKFAAGKNPRTSLRAPSILG